MFKKYAVAAVIAAMAFAGGWFLRPSQTPSPIQVSAEEQVPTASEPELESPSGPNELRQPSAVRTFAFYNNGYKVEQIAANGLDTDTAVIKGVATEASIKEWCELDPGGYGDFDKCIRRTLAENKGQVHSIEADCEAETVTNGDGTFRVAGYTEENGLLIRAEGDEESRDILGNNMFEAYAGDAFRRLCPASFQKYPEKH